MSVKDIHKQASPLVKLLVCGTSKLSDAGLLDLLLHASIAGKGVQQTADELMQIRGQLLSRA